MPKKSVKCCKQWMHAEAQTFDFRFPINLSFSSKVALNAINHSLL